MTPVIQGSFSPNIRNIGVIRVIYYACVIITKQGPGDVRCTSGDQNRPVQPKRQHNSRSLHSYIRQMKTIVRSFRSPNPFRPLLILPPKILCFNFYEELDTFLQQHNYNLPLA